MSYITIACFSFLVIHTVDIVSLKKVPRIKPVIWALGVGMLVYALVMLMLQPDKLAFPVWAVWLGWVLFLISLYFLIYALFINLPFLKTYVKSGFSDELVKTGMYSLARHPGVLWFILVMFSLILISGTTLILIAAPLLIFLDIVLVIVQDKVFFGKMFSDYPAYQRQTPMIVPNSKSIAIFINGFRRTQVK